MQQDSGAVSDSSLGNDYPKRSVGWGAAEHEKSQAEDSRVGGKQGMALELLSGGAGGLHPPCPHQHHQQSPQHSSWGDSGECCHSERF